MAVHDGDTLTLDGQRIRLWGIDAPELAQLCQQRQRAVQCGTQAKAALVAIIGTNPVHCETVDVDRYRRTVARCSLNGRDVGEEMVEQGWALDYGRYSRGYYSAQERAAKAAGAGVWGYVFDKPWEWRKNRN